MITTGWRMALGIASSALAGISTYLGLVLQKKAVNEIIAGRPPDGFMKTLAKNPLWRVGLLLSFGLATLFFIVASVILIVTNVLAITETQTAFRYGPVSKVVPIQQIPVQVAPAIYYYYAFLLKSPRASSPVLMALGVALISTSGFFLAKKQEAMTARG